MHNLLHGSEAINSKTYAEQLLTVAHPATNPSIAYTAQFAALFLSLHVILGQAHNTWSKEDLCLPQSNVPTLCVFHKEGIDMLLLLDLTCGVHVLSLHVPGWDYYADYVGLDFG